MKKALSVLLVAAAVFGFYGSAVSVNDILACKDYWEEAGEKSTADMNKLEDGLNQLKENEQAYLDGKKQVEDGEVALADAEQQLADGEAKLASGRAELAQGEADYAAAPAQLADARRQIAAGEAAVANGENQLASLNRLIDGIQQVLDGYPEFSKGYKQLRDGRVGAIKKPANTDDLVKVLKAYAQFAGDSKAYTALQSLDAAKNELDKQDASEFTNKQYEGFNSYLKKMVKALDDSNAFFDATKKNLKTVAASFQSVFDDAKDAATKYGTVGAAGQAYKTAAVEAQKNPTPENIDAMNQAKAQYDGAVAKYGDLDSLRDDLNNKIAVAAGTAGNEKLAGAVNLAIEVFIKSKDAGTAAAVSGALSAAQAGLTVDESTTQKEITEYLTALGTVPTALVGGKDANGNKVAGVTDGITDVQNKTLKSNKETANKWIKGYKTITSDATTAKLNTLTDGVAQIIGGVFDSGNAELINGMNAAAAAAGFKPEQFTPKETSKLTKDLNGKSKLEDFYNDMNNIEKGFKSVLPALQNKADSGAGELEAGKSALSSGKSQYAAGLAAYEAAPAKLADGRRQLAEGEATLADGYKQYEEGKQALADGKAQLAQYEDGEQQVRDGLATLFNTEPDLDLESIADRLNGDGDFDNGDSHLDLDEGLSAVDVGRGYQADDGVLITKEIMGRAIGTGGLLAAGVLAVIAAILSFLKKNKGAGVFAILAAAAGVFGIAYGTQAGTYFSSIAGSAVGATGWIAAGILGAVALVHAIVHFASPKNA